MAVQRQGRMRWYARSDLTTGCLGKTRWSTEEAAQWAVTRIKREHPEAMSSTVRPYRCPFGKKTHFHVGHGQ